MSTATRRIAVPHPRLALTALIALLAAVAIVLTIAVAGGSGRTEPLVSPPLVSTSTRPEESDVANTVSGHVVLKTSCIDAAPAGHC